MKIGDFGFFLAVSGAASALLLLPEFGGIPPLFAAALFAMSAAGYFALQKLRADGLPCPKAELLYVLAVFGCFFVAILPFFAFSFSLSLIYAPLVISVPAIVSVARDFISGE